MINRRIILGLLTLLPALAACSMQTAPSPLVGSEPAADSVETRPPRTLRLYFASLPDVERSEVSLEGSSGPLELRGMHTMGANDLMMEIDSQLPDGEYQVRWTTQVSDDPRQYQGEYRFTVRSAQ